MDRRNFEKIAMNCGGGAFLGVALTHLVWRPFAEGPPAMLLEGMPTADAVGMALGVALALAVSWPVRSVPTPKPSRR